jgi:hypothetical protein
MLSSSTRTISPAEKPRPKKIFCLCFQVIILAAIPIRCVSGLKYQATETSKVIPETWKPGWIGEELLEEAFPDGEGNQAELTVRSGLSNGPRNLDHWLR